MDAEKTTLTREILRISHPWVLLASILCYALGAGLEVYLGGTLRGDIYAAGQIAVLILLSSAYFLREYYSLPLVIPARRGEPAPLFSRNGLLMISATLLTVGALLTVVLFSAGALQLPAFIFLGAAFVLAMTYALPPLRLAYSGYGELVLAVLLANLTPGLAFLFQTGEYHRLLALLTFPLTFLCLAANLAVHLTRYAEDVRLERKTMLTRLGWQRGMNLHNLLILIGFLVLGSAALVGLPWSLTWPGLLGLPFGVFQIVQMNSIAAGAKPRWRLLMITAATTFALTAYFIAWALWTS
jgi:1,4-dihydroxy-2-naphthoate octaprenyltransferase